MKNGKRKPRVKKEPGPTDLVKCFVCQGHGDLPRMMADFAESALLGRMKSVVLEEIDKQEKAGAMPPRVTPADLKL